MQRTSRTLSSVYSQELCEAESGSTLRSLLSSSKSPAPLRSLGLLVEGLHCCYTASELPANMFASLTAFLAPCVSLETRLAWTERGGRLAKYEMVREDSPEPAIDYWIGAHGQADELVDRCARCRSRLPRSTTDEDVSRRKQAQGPRLRVARRAVDQSMSRSGRAGRRRALPLLRPRPTRPRRQKSDPCLASRRSFAAERSELTKKRSAVCSFERAAHARCSSDACRTHQRWTACHAYSQVDVSPLRHPSSFGCDPRRLASLACQRSNRAQPDVDHGLRHCCRAVPAPSSFSCWRWPAVFRHYASQRRG